MLDKSLWLLFTLSLSSLVMFPDSTPRTAVAHIPAGSEVAPKLGCKLVTYGACEGAVHLFHLA